MSSMNLEQSTELENVSNLVENLGEPSPIEIIHPWADSPHDGSINMAESFAAMASIRSSRRRTKGTAVVSINADHIQKYLEKDKISTDNDRPSTAPVLSSSSRSPIKDAMKKSAVNSLNKKILDKSLDVSKFSSTPSPKTPEPSPPKEETVVSPKGPSKEDCAAKLRKWWKNLQVFKNAKFSQFGRWNNKQSQTIFALFLGYRVRRLLKHSSDVKNLRVVIQDVYHTLVDLLQLPTHNKKGGIVPIANMTKIESFVKEIREDTYHNNCRSGVVISDTELSMVKAMIKQLTTEKEKFHSLLFAKAHWLTFPSPGYWDLSIPIQALTIRQRNVMAKQHSSRIGASPARSIRTPNHDTLVTPPNFRRVINNSNSKNSNSKIPISAMKVKHNDLEALEAADKMDSDLSNELKILRAPDSVMKTPQPLSDLMLKKDRPITGSGGGIDNIEHHHHRSTSAVEYHQPSDTHTHHVRSSSSGATLRPSTAPSSVHQPKSVKCRHSDKPHIQLDIMSAEKLMPAKKGGKARDINTGEAIADRIPCLKVTLLLPPWSGKEPPQPGAEMKKVAHVIRDFDVVTLNPQWNTTFVLNLPCTRSMLKSLLSSNDDDIDVDHLSVVEYNQMCEDLLLWYSYGLLNIEVKDGERFNEEIFLGQANIMLSGITRSVKKHDFNSLEISGNFQLEKQKANQRVSGSIKIHAYIHAPERSFVTETLHVSPSHRRSVNKSSSQDYEVASAAASATARLKSISRKLNAGLFNNTSNNNMSDYQEDSDREANASPRLSSPPPVTYGGKVPLPAASTANAPAYSSQFMKSLAKGKVLEPTSVSTTDVTAPQLEESVNVKYVVSGTSKVLKKLPAEQRTVDAVIRNATAAQQEQIQQMHKRSSSGSRSNNVSVNDSVNAGNGGANRRMFIQDITKQLDGLSSVQQSTDTVLGNFNKKLNEKRVAKRHDGNDYSLNDESAEISGMMVNNYMTYGHHPTTDNTLEEGENESIGSDDDAVMNAREKIAVDMKVSHRMIHSNSASLIEDEDRPEMGDHEETASNYSFQDEVIEHTDDGGPDSDVEDADWQDVSNELKDIVNDCLPHKTLSREHPLVTAGANVVLSIVHNNDISYAIENYDLDNQQSTSMQNNTTIESQSALVEDDSELVVLKGEKKLIDDDEDHKRRRSVL